MTLEEFKLLARGVTGTRSVQSVHPLKLARWHQELFGLPESLFMQQGCGPQFEQLTSAVTAVSKMLNVLGPELKQPLRELARRQVGTWTLVTRARGGSRSFLLRWTSSSNSWVLRTPDDEGMKAVESLEVGVETAERWTADMDELEARDEAELRGTLGETQSAPRVEET
jgi:hypothetical protein